MTRQASISYLQLGFLPVASLLLPILALVGGCGGSADAGGADAGGAGVAGTGASAGSPAAGSGSAGAPSGGSGAGGSGGMGASCIVGDKTYASGSSFPGSDGCNKCSCLDGQLACTLLACELPPPKLCGGIAGIACDKGQYCKYPDGAQCGAADQSGECSSMAVGCLTDFAPVCGCDGKQYGNACSAASSGVSVAHTGACSAPAGSCSVTADGVSYPDGTANIPAGDGCNVCTCNNSVLSCSARPCKAPTPCGGFAGNTCTAAEYCAYHPDGLCGRADAEALCAPRPSACSTLNQPVCGCDGKTYLNTCSAALAGTGILQTGACDHDEG
ncbi:MAG: Kazal-type serine protease inhibitor domain-containing protein [Pseudomonadota bacterium]